MKFLTLARLIISPLILIGLVLGMQACGGGGGSTPAPTDANPTGYYDNTGTVTVDDDGAGAGAGVTAISDLQAMINGNRFMMISDAQGLFYDGAITSISVNDFTANVSVFKHGKPIVSPNATITGTITEKSRIDGSITGTGAGNSNVDFRLQYASNNNLASDLTRIEGTGLDSWDSEIGGENDETVLIINAAGNVISMNSAINGNFANCILSSGVFTPINGTSLYNATINVTNCADTNANLTYVGLAATWTFATTDDRAVIGVTDTNSIFSINGDFF